MSKPINKGFNGEIEFTDVTSCCETCNEIYKLKTAGYNPRMCNNCQQILSELIYEKKAINDLMKRNKNNI